MARFCSLFSSSSGNCTYIASSSEGILIDAGVSAKRISEALSGRSIDPSSLSAIFVTHEHGDHIGGIRVFASKYGIPVYATKGTLNGMEAVGALNGKYSYDVVPYSGIEVGGLFVKPFPTPHDTPESCGYTVVLPDERKIGVATDIGHMTEDILSALKKCDLVLIESNHDVGMLENGSYPYPLKRRILSDTGHLCNEMCAKAVKRLLETGSTRFFLGHLSEQNNMPALAYQTTFAELSAAGAVLNKDYTLSVCPKVNPGAIVKF